MGAAATSTQIHSTSTHVLETTSLSYLEKTPIAHYQVKPLVFIKVDEVNLMCISSLA